MFCMQSLKLDGFLKREILMWFMGNLGGIHQGSCNLQRSVFVWEMTWIMEGCDEKIEIINLSLLH